jgi:hypothetical protein
MTKTMLVEGIIKFDDTWSRSRLHSLLRDDLINIYNSMRRRRDYPNGKYKREVGSK